MRLARVVVLSLVGAVLCGRAQSATPAAAAPRDAGAGVDPAKMEHTALVKQVTADRDRLRACFQRERAIDPAIEDHMFTMVYVAPDGKVKDMKLIAAEKANEPRRPDPPLSQKMAECLGVMVMKWTFPPTSWEGRVQLAEPLGVGGMMLFFSSKPPPDPNSTGDREAIRAVVRQHNGDMKECYDDFLGRKGSTRKPIRVEVTMTVEKGGVVTDAVVREPAPKLEAKFKACVLAVARKMKFPEPREGDSKTIITYPFLFELDR